jgi:AraC-like DNA-binding protein
MIISRDSFRYRGQPIIEKLVITPPFRYEAIFQNEGCFIYVSGGSANVQSPSEKLQIKCKEAVLLKCDTYFVDFLKTTSSQSIEVYAIHLFPELLKELYRNEIPEMVKQATRGKRLLKFISEDITTKFIHGLEFYFDNPKLVNDDLMALKIKELILLLLQTKNAGSLSQLLSDLFTFRKANLKDVVHLYIYSSLTVEELAKLCHLSLSSFKREFKSVFNDSPNNYINTQKLKRAKELLELSDKRVSEIAYEVGYDDPSYFTRLFKKAFNIIPTDLRPH